MAPGQAPALVAQILDMAVCPALDVGAGHLYQGATQTTQTILVVVHSRHQENLDFLHALLYPPANRGTAHKATNPMDEMIDVANLAKVAQEAGRIVTGTPMFQNTTTALIAQETPNLGLQIQIGALQADAITGVSRHGEEVEVLALEI